EDSECLLPVTVPTFQIVGCFHAHHVAHFHPVDGTVNHSAEAVACRLNACPVAVPAHDTDTPLGGQQAGRASRDRTQGTLIAVSTNPVGCYQERFSLVMDSQLFVADERGEV